MAGSEAIEEIVRDLEAIGERLGDEAMEVLRGALADGSEASVARAKATERLINRARAAVEKAARLTRHAIAAELEPSAEEEELA